MDSFAQRMFQGKFPFFGSFLPPGSYISYLRDTWILCVGFVKAVALHQNGMAFPESISKVKEAGRH
jgi:hypothetical protein